MAQQSTLPIVLAGTAAVHLIIAVAIDIASVVGREEDDDEPMTLGLVEIDTRELLPPPPPEEAPPDETPPEVAPPEVAPPPTPVAPKVPRARTARSSQPPPANVPVASESSSVDPGGGPVVSLPGIAPAATGVAAAPGPATGRPGRGGKGRGTGEGDGSGPGSAPAPVVATSIASIKKPAEAKDGFDYFDARRAYPAEARRLGIEGKIRVRLLVDATGKVTQAKLLGSLGHGLDELALARARAIQFTPALDTDDKPVASTVVWTFTFTLPSDT